MSNELDPIEGQWYWHHDKGQAFVVVAVDGNSVEIQHYDGDLEEMELAVWRDLEIETSEPPEDWTGPVDDVETDDLGYSDAAMERQHWAEPGEDYRRRREGWANEPQDRAEEEEDEEAGEPREEAE